MSSNAPYKLGGPRLRPTAWSHWYSAFAAFLMLVCGVATAISPILGIGAFLFIASVAGFLRSGTFAASAFVAVSLFPNLTQYIGPNLSPVKLLGAALIVVAFLTFVTTSHHTRAVWSERPIPIVLLAAFLTFSTASVAWASNISILTEQLQRLITDGLAMVAVGVVLQQMYGLKAVAWTTLVAATITAIYGLVTHANFADRAIGTFADPNEYAAILVPAFAFGYILFDAAQKRWQQVVIGLSMLLIFYTILETQSRGGLLALIAAVIVLTITSHGNERLRLVGFMLVTVAMSTAFVLGTPQGQDLIERSVHGDSSGRSDLWRVAQNEFRDNPIVGVGLGNFAPRAKEYLSADVTHTNDILKHPKAAHNAYLEILAELGAVGLALFLAFVAACVISLIKGIRKARKWGDIDSDRLGRGYLAAIVGILVSEIFLSGQYQQLLWVLLGCCLVFAYAVTPRDASGAQADIAR